MSNKSSEALQTSSKECITFPIGELSSRTQVHTVTLRAWERRYGLLKPQRTPKGHRLYNENDVATVEKILALVARGARLSKIKPLLESFEEEKPDENSIHWSRAVEDLKSAVETLSFSKIQHLINEKFANYPAQLCSSNWIKPCMAALSKHPDKDMLTSVLSSEIARYTHLRLNAKSAKNAKITLICGSPAIFWQYALMALILSDAQISVLIFSQPMSLQSGLQLATQLVDTIPVYYQDGTWIAQDINLANSACDKNKQLLLCGTAPALALALEKPRADRVFSDLDDCCQSLLKMDI